MLIVVWEHVLNIFERLRTWRKNDKCKTTFLGWHLDEIGALSYLETCRGRENACTGLARHNTAFQLVCNQVTRTLRRWLDLHEYIVRKRGKLRRTNIGRKGKTYMAYPRVFPYTALNPSLKQPCSMFWKTEREDCSMCGMKCRPESTKGGYRV